VALNGSLGFCVSREESHEFLRRSGISADRRPGQQKEQTV
jgi:hypothetical protein